MGKHRNVKSDRFYGDGRGGGYKNPSEDTQFKKGLSGNPSGKNGLKKTSPSDLALAAFVKGFEASIATSTGEPMSMIEGMVTQICRASVNDPRLALRMFEGLAELEKSSRPAPEVQLKNDNLSDDDKRLLDEALDRRLEERDHLVGRDGGSEDIGEEARDD